MYDEIASTYNKLKEQASAASGGLAMRDAYGAVPVQAAVSWAECRLLPAACSEPGCAYATYTCSNRPSNVSSAS